MTRIAFIADVHGNLAALEAVIRDLDRTSPDLVVHGGDLALSGPRPAEVVDTVREQGWLGVVGNTDELLWSPEQLKVQRDRAPKLGGLLHVLFEKMAPVTAELLGTERIDWLRKLPTLWTDGSIALVHAAPDDLWRASQPDASDDEILERYGALEAQTVVYGHIHRAFMRFVRGRVVVNTGSVGMPYDGDPRASYLLMTDGNTSIRRVEYDIQRDANDLLATKYPYAEWLAAIRRTGRYEPPPTPK